MKKFTNSIWLISCLAALTSCGQDTKETKQEINKETKQNQQISDNEKATGPTSSSQTGEGNADIKSFVPNGYSILNQTAGDLNEDGISDLILVLNPSDEIKAKEEGKEPSGNRKLLILIGNNDKQYQLVRQNDKTVHCYDCGGVMGDPFQGISIKNGYFSVEHMGGAGMRWTRIITYKYNKAENEWYLHKDGGEYFHAADPNKIEESHVSTTKDFGKIKFENYDIDKENNK